MHKGFSFNRVYKLIKRDLVLLRGALTTSVLVAVVLLFLFSIFNMIWDQQLSTSEFFGIFGIFYIPLGLLFTFALFREFNDSKKNHMYLILPVSIPERLFAKWLTSTLIYTFVFSVIAVLVGMFAMIVGIIVFGADFTPISLVSVSYWDLLKTYFLVQPVFLVGAITFKRNRVGKTILSLGVLVLCFALLHFILYALFNYSLGVFETDGLGSVAFDKAGSDFSSLGKWFYVILLGPVMLAVAYFKMTEKEV
ncbi:hypothetical protein [Flagellimonas flava]|uniref:ABC-2 family transporter protein n=1 Tax=Flagellimonas flava TaxID=570519 RepID=A0A1M5I527_9FLAO|nr:hypothetical protein [Allomuricauda flava]SHG23436.1 hypothetical protein SAMN04488116_0446 [Allomuricauda flava]